LDPSGGQAALQCLAERTEHKHKRDSQTVVHAHSLNIAFYSPSADNFVMSCET